MRMEITVRARLFASLRKWKPDDAAELRVEAPCTVRSALAGLGVPEREVAIAMLNGKRAAMGQELADGDELQVFPAIGGG